MAAEPGTSRVDRVRTSHFTSEVTDIVDAWAQHPNAAFMAQPWLATLGRWTRQELRAPDLADTLGAMDAAGVSTALLSAWHGPHGPLITNDEVAAVVAAAPDRFAGVATADLTDPVRAVAEVRRCVQEQGVAAVRVVPWLWTLPPNDRRYYPLYVACVELGVPFCTQVGHTGPLCPSETGRPVPYLDRAALDLPELVIVGGHIGHPWTNEMIGVAWKHDNVYIDTSAY